MSQNITVIHGFSNETMGGVNPGSNHHITTTSCTPPPSFHSIDLPPGNPAISSDDRRPPPSYEEVIDPNAPPPAYDLLFGRVREARKTFTGVFNFLLNIIFLLLGTIGYTIMIGVSSVIPICMLVIGGIYLHDCPQNEYIPIYLLIGGGFSVFKQLSVRVSYIQEDRDEQRVSVSLMHTLINGFMLGWFIIGSMWVYKEYEPNYDPALGKYCNKTLYLFAFWLITLSYICLGVMIVGLCSISVADVVFQRWA